MKKEDQLITDLYNVATILKNAELTDKGKLFHKDVLDFISNPKVYLLDFQNANSSSSNVQYADVILSGMIPPKLISNSPRDDTVFEIFKNEGKGIQIGIWSGAEKRVLKNQDFASGADIQKTCRFPTNLKCELGILQRTDDGGYRVVTRPRIILF